MGQARFERRPTNTRRILEVVVNNKFGGPARRCAAGPTLLDWPPKMLYFFSIHLRIHPKPAFVFDITPHIDAKLAAIRCYESQFVTGRDSSPPTILDDIRDRARYWGWTIGVPFAEPFASREEIGLRDLRSLV